MVLNHMINKKILIRIMVYPLAYVLWGGYMWYYQLVSPYDLTHYLLELPLCNSNFYNFLQSLNPIIIEFFRIIYTYFFSISIIGGIGFYLLYKKNLLKSDKIMIDIALGWLIAGIIYAIFIVKSPFQAGVGHDLINLHYLWITTRPEYEIPSLHTAYSVLIALHYIGEKHKIKYLFIALGILIPISTLITGQHWVVDVIAGIIFGYLLYKIPEKYYLNIYCALNSLAGAPCKNCKRIN